MYTTVSLFPLKCVYYIALFLSLWAITKWLRQFSTYVPIYLHTNKRTRLYIYVAYVEIIYIWGLGEERENIYRNLNQKYFRKQGSWRGGGVLWVVGIEYRINI